MPCVTTVSRSPQPPSHVASHINVLTSAPEQRGTPLSGPLANYYAMRAVGKRYCILSHLEHDTVIVHVLALGIR